MSDYNRDDDCSAEHLKRAFQREARSQASIRVEQEELSKMSRSANDDDLTINSNSGSMYSSYPTESSIPLPRAPEKAYVDFSIFERNYARYLASKAKKQQQQQQKK